MTTDVTVWYRRDERGVFEFNHFEDGRIIASYPTPKFPSQTKAWSSGVWQSKPGILTDDIPAKLILVDNV
jgi:hypothetical protein